MRTNPTPASPQSPGPDPVKAREPDEAAVLLAGVEAGVELGSVEELPLFELLPGDVPAGAAVVVVDELLAPDAVVVVVVEPLPLEDVGDVVVVDVGVVVVVDVGVVVVVVVVGVVVVVVVVVAGSVIAASANEPVESIRTIAHPDPELFSGHG
ncbi:MAG TPA: hypothetical protein VEJ87_16630 [Acidimicrobiales bacterium]|nr:hypothetical protein [Acidimicrobiales bacterium]